MASPGSIHLSDAVSLGVGFDAALSVGNEHVATENRPASLALLPMIAF